MRFRFNLQSITHTFISTSLVVTLLYAIGTSTSCSRGSRRANPDVAFADSIINKQYDSLFVDPDAAMARLSDAQKLITDSIAYYRIELYKSLSRVVLGNWHMVDSMRDATWRFCLNAPESNALHSLKSLYWNHTAVILINCRGNRDSAIVCFNNALNELQQAGDESRKELIPVCINLADAYRLKGDASNASRFYRRALAVADSTHSSSENMSIYCGLAQVYSDIENFREANTYFDRAERIINSDTSGAIDTYSRYHFYVSAGNNFYFQKRYPDALAVFKKASKLSNMLGVETHFIADVNLGEVFMLMGELDSAQVYLSHAEEIFKSLPHDPVKSFYINSLLGHFELNRDNLPQAINYLQTASADSAYAGPRYLALHYERLRNYFSRRGDFKRAYRCLTRSRYYLDSINNNAVRNQIAEIDMRYVQDTTKLHTNLIISQKDDEMKHLEIQIYILIIVSIIIASAAIIYILVRRRRRIEKEMQLQNLIVSQRLDNMRNRLSPHFVFNVLNRELAANNEGINNLVSLMRKNLELCERYTVSLAEELDFIDTYIANERPALGDGFTFKKVIDPALCLDDITIPAMMVQIFVENAVKHGLRAITSDKHLLIEVTDAGGFIHIKVENNSPLRAEKSLLSGTGTGLRVITQTIQLLNDRNRNKIELDIRNAPSDSAPDQAIWTVALSIPRGFNFYISGKQPLR
ncbi:MAG: tetratricopeptide repeat protein [Muribaculaceae bacterium]